MDTSNPATPLTVDQQLEGLKNEYELVGKIHNFLATASFPGSAAMDIVMSINYLKLLGQGMQRATAEIQAKQAEDAKTFTEKVQDQVAKASLDASASAGTKPNLKESDSGPQTAAPRA